MIKDKKVRNISEYWYYILFLVVEYMKHIPMGYISDDAVKMKSNSWLSGIELVKYYWFNEYSGRLFIDTLGDLLFRIPLGIWKMIDSLVYLGIVLLIVYLFDIKDADKPLVCGLVMLFPMSFMSSAGYISTTVNYLYPIFALLLAYAALKLYAHKGKKYIYYVILSIVPIIYAMNSDQAAIMHIGLCIVGLVIVIFNYSLDNAVLKKFNLILAMSYSLLCGIIGYSLYLFSPGHRARVQNVGGSWSYPGFENWSFITKIYRGYTTTVANVMMQYVGIYFFISVVLIILVFAKKCSSLNKILISIPFLFSTFEMITKYRFFAYSGDNMFGMYDMYLMSEGKKYELTFIWSIVVVSCLFYGLSILISDKYMKIVACTIFLLGCGSRLIMGFSSTLFGSSTRTFTLMLYSLVICMVILIKEFDNLDNKYYMMISGALMSTVMISFLLG